MLPTLYGTSPGNLPQHESTRIHVGLPEAINVLLNHGALETLGSMVSEPHHRSVLKLCLNVAAVFYGQRKVAYTACAYDTTETRYSDENT